MKKILYFVIPMILLLGFSCKPKQFTLTIKFDGHHDDMIYTVSKKESINEPENVVIDHGKVSGYIYDDGTKVTFPLSISKNTTIKAVVDMEMYTYKFINYDNSVIKEETAEYGTKIIYPDNPERPGSELYDFTFTKWSNDDVYLTRNVTFKAIFTRNEKSVIIKLISYDGTETILDHYCIGDSLSEPKIDDIPVEEGYYANVLGWFNQETGEQFDFSNDYIKGDLILECRVDIAKIGKQKLKGSTISIIGDSISTFYEKNSEANSFYHGENQYHYPIYSQTVKNVEQTWWYQTILNVNARLGINNSWAGTDNASSSHSAGKNPSRLKTLDYKGNPDIVFIFMGTNDNGNGNSVEKFRESFIYQIEYINSHFTIKKDDGMYYIPEIYIFTLGYSKPGLYNSTEERRLAYNEEIRKLDKLYENVNIFDLAIYITEDNYEQYLGDRVHYNDKGMKLIADRLTERLNNDYNVEKVTKYEKFSPIFYLKKKKDIYGGIKC